MTTPAGPGWPRLARLAKASASLSSIDRIVRLIKQMTPEHGKPSVDQLLARAESSRAQVSHAHLVALIQNAQLAVREIDLSTNAFGEFLFLTASPTNEMTVGLTFYGLGYHDYRERWITDVWGYYAASKSRIAQAVIPHTEALAQIAERLEAVQDWAKVASPSGPNDDNHFKRLADLTDDDFALAEIEDSDDLG